VIVADTSAIVAVLTNEPDGPMLADLMEQDGTVLVSAATAVEFLIVAFGKGESIYQDGLRFLEESYVDVVPLDFEQSLAAAHAHQTYGRGRHPAALNLGDTFAYALATIRGLPLLFKGNDFSQTDVAPAAPTAG
jgi:ribonuclease VapC